MRMAWGQPRPSARSLLAGNHGPEGTPAALQNHREASKAGRNHKERSEIHAAKGVLPSAALITSA